MSPEQMIFLGLLASALTFILRLLATYGNIHLGRFLANVLLFIVSAVLAVAWTYPTLPPFDGNVAAWAVAIVELAAPLVVFAQLIYNALYDRVVVPLWTRYSKK